MKTEKAAFGAGCFWHIEHEFGKLEGVIDTKVGFMGGEAKNPTYKQVCSGKTGHAETVLVEFDPKKVKYENLLELFFKIHDPASLNRQGLDFGTQYRSVIFYFNEKQKKEALASIEKERTKRGKKIVTEVVPASDFYLAEDYHQKYFEKGVKAKLCHLMNELTP